MKELVKPTKLEKKELTLRQYAECSVHNDCFENFKDCGYNVCEWNWATEEDEEILF